MLVDEGRASMTTTEVSKTIEPREVGAFTMEVLEPGLIYLIWRGTADAESFEGLRAFDGDCRAAFGADRPIHAIVDAKHATGLVRSMRQQLFELSSEHPWDRIVVIGMRFELEVVLELVARGLRLLKSDTGDIAFVDSLEQAQAKLRDWG